MTKAGLVCRTELNFKVLSKYLDFLMARGLIERKHSSKLTLYRMTRKGRMWLPLFTKLIDLLGRNWALPARIGGSFLFSCFS